MESSCRSTPSAGGTAWIDRVEVSPALVARAIDGGLAATGKLPAPGETWAVKLNLTYPRYLPGVVNSPIFVEGLCRWAADRRVRLLLIEGDGGNGSYTAEDTFAGNGVSALADRYGMRCVSVSRKPWHWRTTKVGGKSIRLPYSPFFQERPYDRLIVTPLFKNHVFTYVTLGMKNLWGCIPDAYRMYYHNILDEGIVALVRELQPEFSIFDGLVALRGRGPMDGKPVDMNAVMVADSVGAGEAAALSLMSVKIQKVRHLYLARQEGLMPSPDQVRWLNDPAPFIRDDFLLDRSLLNYASIQLARFPLLQRIIYHSPLSSIIYALVNLIRRGSAQAQLANARRTGRYHVVDIQDRS